MSVGSEGRLTADLATSLDGLTFPVRKAEIVDLAAAAGADAPTLDVLGKLPDREYGSMEEVEGAVARVPGHT